MNKRSVFLLSLILFGLLLAACTTATEPAVPETAVLPPTAQPSATPQVEVAAEASPTAPPLPTMEPEPAATAAPQDDLSAFSAALQSALVDGNVEFLTSQMSDPFGFGAYRSEWQLLTPAEMAPYLETLLPEGAVLKVSAPETDLTIMLDGQDPRQMMGPDVTVAAAWHIAGWGPGGTDEAILFIEELGDGRFAWKALLVAPGGFLPASAELPILDEQPAPAGLLYAKPDGSLWRVAQDGSSAQIWSQEGTPAFPAPDGQHAYYQIQGDLFLLNVATGESTRLTSDHDDQGTHLTGYHRWMDNGTILSGVLLDWQSEGGPNFGHPATIDINSGKVTILDSQALMSSYPSISADGVLAYTTVQRSANDTQTTWIYDPQTGVTAFKPADFEGAPEGFYSSPAWSEDGRFLAWLVSDGTNVQLAVFELEAQTVTVYPSFMGAAFGGPYPNPIFNEDGNWIALRQLTNDPLTSGLWLYSPESPEPVFVAHNGGELLWVNDHLLLFIDYDENMNAQLQQFDIFTGVRSVVTLPEAFQIYTILVP